MFASLLDLLEFFSCEGNARDIRRELVGAFEDACVCGAGVKTVVGWEGAEEVKAGCC